MVSLKSPDSVRERQKGGETGGGASDAAAAVCVASAQLKAAAACLVAPPDAAERGSCLLRALCFLQIARKGNWNSNQNFDWSLTFHLC